MRITCSYEYPRSLRWSCLVRVRPARPIAGLANCDEAAPHPRLLPPRLVARLVGGQDDARATGDFALDLGASYRTAADDAGPAGSSMGLGHPLDRGQAARGQPNANLPPQVIIRESGHPGSWNGPRANQFHTAKHRMWTWSGAPVPGPPHVLSGRRAGSLPLRMAASMVASSARAPEADSASCTRRGRPGGPSQGSSRKGSLIGPALPSWTLV